MDSFFAYFLLGRSEMLVSGLSIFQCFSWDQLKNSMYECSCRLACNLLHSFQLSSWGWVWMVLGLLMLFAVIYCTAGELKTISKSLGVVHFVSRFRWIRRSRLQSCCGCSFHWVFDVIDCCWFWKMVLRRFGMSGLFAWSGRICCSNAEYRWAFLRRGFSCGGCDLTRLRMRCLVDVRGLVGLSGPGSRTSSPCWERLEFPWPYRFRATQ